MRSDAQEAKLGDAKLTLTIANLPFGKAFKADGGNRALYASILRRSLAHAADTWRACLLTSDTEALETAVDDVGALSLARVADITVRGMKATIWLATRK
jgi:23S rRNA G2445 N2-methylase RlmL